MKRAREANRWLPVMAIALLVNALLFTGLPNMLSRETVRTESEPVQSVDFLREKPAPKTIPQKEKPPEPTPPEPPRVVPRQATKAMTQQVQAPNMDMPAFDFDVAPGINMGIAVEPPQAPAAPQPAPLKSFYGLEEVDQAPVATVKTKPAYPYRARRLRLNGEVAVKFLVDTNGRVDRITILQADPPEVFDHSVLQALTSWRFAPGTVSGRPVNTWVTTSIVFKFEDL